MMNKMSREKRTTYNLDDMTVEDIKKYTPDYNMAEDIERKFQEFRESNLEKLVFLHYEDKPEIKNKLKILLEKGEKERIFEMLSKDELLVTMMNLWRSHATLDIDGNRVDCKFIPVESILKSFMSPSSKG